MLVATTSPCPSLKSTLRQRDRIAGGTPSPTITGTSFGLAADLKPDVHFTSATPVVMRRE